MYSHKKLDNMMYCLLEPFKDWPVESIMKSQVASFKVLLIGNGKKALQRKALQEKSPTVFNIHVEMQDTIFRSWRKPYKLWLVYKGKG